MSKEQRPHRRYEKQDLIQAVRAIENKTMSSVKASQLFHVPESTIRSHVLYPSLYVGAGRKHYLTSKQECYLVELIKSMELIGVRLTKVVLKKVVGQFIDLVSKDPRFNQKEPSFHWLSNFLSRNKKRDQDGQGKEIVEKPSKWFYRRSQTGLVQQS